MHFLPWLDLQPFCAPAFLRAHRVGRRMKNWSPSNGWKSSLFLTLCQTAPLIKFLSRLTLKRTTEDEIKTTFIARLSVLLWEKVLGVTWNTEEKSELKEPTRSVKDAYSWYDCPLQSFSICPDQILPNRSTFSPPGQVADGTCPDHTAGT